MSSIVVAYAPMPMRQSRLRARASVSVRSHIKCLPICPSLSISVCALTGEVEVGADLFRRVESSFTQVSMNSLQSGGLLLADWRNDEGGGG